MKTTSNIFNLLFVFFILSVNTFPQEIIDAGPNFKLSISNKNPRLEEIVTLKVDFIVPFDMPNALLIFDFGNAPVDIEFGNKVEKLKLRKNQKVAKILKIKLNEKIVYNISTTLRWDAISKGFSEGVKIFVENAIEEDSEIKNIRNRINIMQENINDLQSNIKQNTLQAPVSSLISITNEQLSKFIYSSSRPEFRNDEYTVIKKSEEYNSLLKKLQNELSLLEKQFKLLKASQYGKNITLSMAAGNGIMVSSSDIIKTTVNHESDEFWAEDANGNIFDMSNWRVNPSSLGNIVEDPVTHRAVLHAGATAGTGEVFATYQNTEYKLFDVEVISHYKIRGSLQFERRSGVSEYIKDCEMGLFDLDLMQYVDYTNTNSNGYYEFNNITSNNIQIVVVSRAPYGYVFNTQNNNYFHGAASTEIRYVAYQLDTNYEFNFGGLVPYSSLPESCGAFNILNEIKKGYDNAYNITSIYPFQLAIDWNTGNFSGDTWYNDTNDYMRLAGHDDEDQWDESVILHEYGHALMDFFAQIPPNASGSHSWNQAVNEELAYSEGWATFFSCYSLNRPEYIDYVNYGTQQLLINVELPTDSPEGNNVEGAICGTLWDIYDSNSDINLNNNDNISLGISNIWSILDTYSYNGHSPYTFYEFSIGWYNNSYLSINEVAAAHGVNVCPYELHISVSPLSTMEKTYYSGAASIQTILNHIWVSESQDNLQSESGAGTSDMNESQVLSVFQQYQPSPYTYNLDYHNSQSNAIAWLAKWVAYDLTIDFTLTAGQPNYVPAMIPFNGNYNNWVVVNGVKSEKDPYDLNGITTIYGFWVSEPYREGSQQQSLAKKGTKNANIKAQQTLSGGESYYPVNTFQNKYSSISENWVTIADPPMLGNVNYRFEVPTVRSLKDTIEVLDFVNDLIENFKNSSKINRIKNILDGKSPKGIERVKDIQMNRSYLIIPFKKAISTYFALILDAEDNYLIKLTVPEEPLNYSLLKSNEVIKNLVENNFITKKEILSYDLVYHPKFCINEYYPAWEIITEDHIYYVNQDNEIFVDNELPKNQQENVNSIVTKYTLNQNYPNPFNPHTVISFNLPKESNVKLQIYNSMGELVRVLINEKYSKGNYSILWDGKNEKGENISSGIYFYRILAGKYQKTLKMNLIR